MPSFTFSELKKISAAPVGLTGVEPEKNRTNLKIVVLAFFGAIFSAFFGYFLNLFLTHKDLVLFSRFFVSNDWLAAVAFFIFLAIFLLQTIFIEDFWKTFIVVFLEFISILVAFSFDKIKILSLPDWRFLAGAGVVFLLLLFSAKKGKNGLRDMIKIKFLRLGKIILPAAIAAMFLFVSVAYAYGIDKKEFVVPYSDFKALFSSSKYFIDKIYSGVDISWTVEEFGFYLAQKQIGESSQFSILPKSVQKQLVDTAAKELIKKIPDLTGVPVNAKLPITEALYEVLKYKLLSFSQNSQFLISLAVVLLIFLTLEGIAIPVRWIIAILAFIMYEILIAADFAKISYEGISKENISLK